MESRVDTRKIDGHTKAQGTPEISQTLQANTGAAELDGKKSLEINTVELSATQTFPPPHESNWSFQKAKHVFIKFLKFTGPGAVISVAYIDPDNFQGAISAGAMFKYKLLFMVLLANIIAVYLQAISAKLGCVTGLNLAEMNRKCLPRWANFALWLLAEAAIICTDVGQVIGTAIALNLLCPRIPVMAGCALSVTDALLILLFYRPDGKLNILRAFESFIAALVIGIFVCFCMELSKISAPVGEIFKGFLPSKTVFDSQGLYQSCAIIGGTIMPHSIYLGSGLVQARFRDFDIKEKLYKEPGFGSDSVEGSKYIPSLRAIRSCMSYTLVELCATVFIVAVFVNSAILIVAAASLSAADDEDDLYGMYNLFKESISQGAATLLAISLLFSGTLSGIVATLAGQMVMEGAMHWHISPFVRRLVTRCIAVIPALIIAAAVGPKGLGAALNGCNYVLSIALIFITAPLIWYTSRNKHMSVQCEQTEAPLVVGDGKADAEQQRDVSSVSFANGWTNTVFGIFSWALITFLNITIIVLLGLGIGGD